MKLKTKKQLTALYLVVSLFLLYGTPSSESQFAQWVYPVLALANLANAVRLIHKLEKLANKHGKPTNTSTDGNGVSQCTN